MAGHGLILAALLVEHYPQPPVLHEDVLDLHPQGGADAREAVDHECDRRPVASPAGVVTSMESSSRRASSSSSTAVLPKRTTWHDPRTEAVGFTGTTWPVTSQSKRCRMAANCCLTLGAISRPYSSIQLATCRCCTAASDETQVVSHHAKNLPTARA